MVDERACSMFSDQLWTLKVSVAVGVFVGLCWRAHEDLSPLHPSLGHVLVHSGAPEETVISFGALKVLSVGADGFELETDAGPCRVQSPLRPHPGELVNAVGFMTGPRTFRATRARVNEGYEWKRPLVWWISGVTLIVCLWRAKRFFRFRLREGLFRGRG